MPNDSDSEQMDNNGSEPDEANDTNFDPQEDAQSALTREELTFKQKKRCS